MSRPAVPRRVLCFGEALVDFHGEGVDPRGFAARYVPFAGGAPANVAVAVARLGGAAGFVGMLGTDVFGDFLLDSLQRAGVDTRGVVRTGQANTALAFVSRDAHGERSFSFYRPPSADLLFRATHFDDACVREAALFHVCSNSLTDPGLAEATLAGMRRARAAGAVVSFDLNLRPALWPPGSDPYPAVWAALAEADLLKFSREELAWLAAGDEVDASARLWRGRTQLLVVTDGAHPIRWFSRDAEGMAPVRPVPMVDATAAGDAFVGGLLLQLAQAGPDTLTGLLAAPQRLQAVLDYAAACGALTVTRQGSFAAMPTDAQVRAFLEIPR